MRFLQSACAYRFVVFHKTLSLLNLFSSIGEMHASGASAFARQISTPVASTTNQVL